LSHNEYAIAEVKSMATKAEIEKCPGCKVMEYVNSPASEAAQRPAAAYDELGAALRPAALRNLGRRQRLGLCLRCSAVAASTRASEAFVAADGNRSAYDRHPRAAISDGDVSERSSCRPTRRSRAEPCVPRRKPSGFVQPPFLVHQENIHAEGGDQNTFIPVDDYKKHYLRDLGRAVASLWLRPAELAGATPSELGRIGHGGR